MSDLNVRNLDDLPIEGHLSIFLNFENGVTVPFMQERLNVITDSAKERLLAMIYDKNKSVAPDPILTFRVGDGGTLDGTTGLGGIPGSNPRPLSGAETQLFNQINPALYSSTALSHNLENTTPAVTPAKSVTYSFNISSSQLNGYNISEVGLYRESGNIFNIKTFASIPKSSAFSIQFLWTIRYG